MATRKQKRAAALQRRQEFEQERAQSALKAQQADIKRRNERRERAQKRAHEKHYKFAEGCPICDRIKAKQAVEKIAKATA